MSERLSIEAGETRLDRRPLSVRVRFDPFSLALERAGEPLLPELTLWAVVGESQDRFLQPTEGVIAAEQLEAPELIERVDGGVACAGELELDGTLTGGGRRFCLRLRLDPERVAIAFEVAGEPLRVGARWTAAPGERFVGLGANHGHRLDQSGRRVRLGADRRYTGPDCPPDLLDVGGVPMGDCAPLPWIISSAGYGVWLEASGPGTDFDLGAAVEVSTRAAEGALLLHLLTSPTPIARLRSLLRLTGLPVLLPEWAYGHWKSRDVYAHQSDVEDDFDGYARHDLPLDAIVIDSPWETQYNTWRFNPHQFPDAPGLIARMREAGVRTVVWVAPWVNLESNDGQRPPDAESERLHAEPAENYAEGAAAGHFVRSPDGGEPYVAQWWMGTGSPVDFTSEAADAWWRELARPVLELGVEGIKADDGEGYYLPEDVRFADGRRGAQAAWAYGGLYRRSMQRALDDAHPGSGVLFARSAWTGAQADGVTWGGDQVSDFWSLGALVGATLSAAASGFSNWSHDVGGYLGKRLVERCPKELLVRWLEFGCFTPLLHSHGRFEQEAWTYDRETLDVYRELLVLHERLVPYTRAAAATAARCGLPIVRPLCLTDPGDPRGWTTADAYGYGPALWVAPVLEEGARERSVYLPRGEWIDFWTGESVSGGRDVLAEAPLGRIPVWVRCGSIVVTYTEKHVARGLGDAPERERPLEATLWGTPRLGRATARLADGTRIRWRRGHWLVEPGRAVVFAKRPGGMTARSGSATAASPRLRARSAREGPSA